VREESQLDDMRSAIRGDFERLARRRGSQELMRVAPHVDEQPPEQTADEESTVEQHRSWLTRLLSR